MNIENLQKLSEMVRLLMKRLECSQSEMAQHLGTSQSTLNRVLQDRETSWSVGKRIEILYIKNFGNDALLPNKAS